MKLNEETSRWEDVGDRRAAEKVSQTLREKDRTNPKRDDSDTCEETTALESKDGDATFPLPRSTTDTGDMVLEEEEEDDDDIGVESQHPKENVADDKGELSCHPDANTTL